MNYELRIMTVVTTTSANSIRSFTDLNVWREAHELVVMIYGVTKDFPKEEMYGLTQQLRRASVSISSNIAEGFSRKSYCEKLRSNIKFSEKTSKACVYLCTFESLLLIRVVFVHVNLLKV